MKNHLLVTLFLLVTFVLCTTPTKQPYVIYGNVYCEGDACVHAEVLLLSEDEHKVWTSAYSDENGQYRLTYRGKQKDRLKIKARKTQYTSTTIPFTIAYSTLDTLDAKAITLQRSTHSVSQ